MNKQIITFLFVFLVMIFTYSCKSDSNTNNTNNTKEDSVTDVTNDNKSPFGGNMSYHVPSPVELYVFLSDADTKFNKEALNSPDNMEKYYTTSSKALNLGIYASDLGYCTVFEKPQETFLYFKAAKTLADELGLIEGFDEIISKRIENNLNSIDSLYNIAKDAYWDACTYLKQENKTNILGYLMVGSWVESVHIAFNSVEEFSPDNPVVIRIAEQRLLLENLIGLVASVEGDEEINKIIADLEDIQASFDVVDENIDVFITKEQYNDIETKITTLRNKFIK